MRKGNNKKRDIRVKRKTTRVICIMMALILLSSTTKITSFAEEINRISDVTDSSENKHNDSSMGDDFFSENQGEFAEKIEDGDADNDDNSTITTEDEITENPNENKLSVNIDSSEDTCNEDILAFNGQIEGQKERKPKEGISRIDFMHDVAEHITYHAGDDIYSESAFSDYETSDKYYADAYSLLVSGYLPMKFGDRLDPDEAVTREFASFIVRAILGVNPNKDAYIELNDEEDITYMEAAQFVIKSGWLEPVNGAFCPQMLITKVEEYALIDGIEGYYDFLEADEADYVNVYRFADDVIVFEENQVNVLELNDEYVDFEDLTKELHEGQRFAFFYLGLPFAYRAERIVNQDGRVRIYIGEQEDDALIYADAKGTINLSELEQYEEGNEELLGGVSYSGGVISITTENLSVELSNLSFKYAVNNENKYVILEGKYTVTVQYGGKVADFDPSIPITLPVGVVKIGLEANMGG